jgi:(E)-4-hydroxy-3-methylbut-2-enyl-diphosphate synthase
MAMKKVVRIGDIKIGGGYPVAPQTMSNLSAADVSAVIRQAAACFEAGCKIFRIAVPDFEAAAAIGAIKKSVKMPIVADVHFDYRLGVEAAKNGADKLRINPGNMKKDDLKKLVAAAKEYEIPIRVGVNGGSLEKKYRDIIAKETADFSRYRTADFDIKEDEKEAALRGENRRREAAVPSEKRYGRETDFSRYRTANFDIKEDGKEADFSRYKDGFLVAKRAEALAASAMDGVRLLEEQDFFDTVVSLKSSSVRETVAAYRIIDRLCGYPLHIGVTEAGGERSGIIKSAAGLSALLLDGIGDTLRVSLTAAPEKEVAAALSILRAVGLDKDYAEIISCPKCGRCSRDTERLLHTVEDLTANVKKPLKIAIMGCVVNGPGEAEDCDIGIAFGEGRAAVFKNGKVYKSAETDEAEREFLRAVRELISWTETAEYPRGK